MTHATAMQPALRWSSAALAAALLAACGGGGDDDGAQPPTAGAYAVGGTLAGLAAGKTLVLQNNGENDLPLTANGGFQFTTLLDGGVAYAVTVKGQPAGQRCTVSNGTGRVTTDHVRNVQVACENLPAATYTVGGTVTGLAGGTLVLQNNGRDDMAVTANGGFTFATALAGGMAYAVTIKTQPAGQSCTVRNGTGTVASASVGAVEVACATAAAGLPEGDWKQELCVQVRPGTWGRNLWRITRQDEARATARMGMATYANASCTGTATVEDRMTDLGSFAFHRTDATATLAAFWGNWSQPNGRTDPVVWARKGPRLCVLAGDASQTLPFPTAASVESHVDQVIPNKTCYVKD